ncbi:hypothetical protein K439DRAFT_1620765 [Ramaria rubella]|nr:hypothetical protein K439DRAFT_1620765 [Ramaria rubella]
MFKSSLVTLLAASTLMTAHAQFALQIVQPSSQEFLLLGANVTVEIQAPNVAPGTKGPNIQLSLCTEITGVSLCNHTMGTILLNAPFAAPDQAYNVTIPATQQGGLTRLIAGHITDVTGTAAVTDMTSIPVFLGVEA